MKRLFTFLLFCFIAKGLFAQAPVFTKFTVSPVFFHTAVSNLSQFTEINGKLLFYMSAPKMDTTIWQTDGTASGTKPFIKSNVYPNIWTVWNGNVYFTKNDTGSNVDLWVTDGTDAGTHILKDIDPGPLSFTDPFFTHAIYNNKLYFIASDSIHGYELWSTDGTEAGTSMMADINPGAIGSYPRFFVNYNNKLYFSADSGNTSGLWATDGTQAGTHYIKIIDPVSTTGGCSAGKVINNLLVFMANDSNGFEPWVTDGTEAGTYMIKDICPGKKGSLSSTYDEDSFFTAYNGRLYFYADTATVFSKPQLWATDGTTAGTVMIKDIQGQNSKAVFNGKIYTMARENLNPANAGLWVSDGTTAGTTLIKTFSSANAQAGNWPYFVPYHGTLYFTQHDNTKAGWQLWHTDGTSTGTESVMPQNANPNALNYAKDMIVYNEALYFYANYDSSKGQLWSFRGFPAGIAATNKMQPAFSMFPNPAHCDLTVKINNANTGGSVELTDMTGKLICKHRLNGTDIKLPIRNVPKGIYTVTVTTGTQRSSQQLAIE